MPYHFSVIETMLSPEGKEYYPDITRFDGKESVKRHCDSLFALGYRVRKQHVFDIHTLTADYLIDQIDLAFEAWGKPWATNIPKNALLHYRKQTSKGSQPVGMIHEGEYVSARKW